MGRGDSRSQEGLALLEFLYDARMVDDYGFMISGATCLWNRMSCKGGGLYFCFRFKKGIKGIAQEHRMATVRRKLVSLWCHGICV